MAKKMSGRLVALSASAVATIYLAGFISTQSGTQSAAASSSTVSVLAVATATAVPTAASTSTYADGTYSATGTSAVGNVSVSVTIADDKISNVQITKATTKLPASRIASLPAQIIQNQTANVNVVTGATYSSQAFKQAVQQALAQAKGA